MDVYINLASPTSTETFPHFRHVHSYSVLTHYLPSVFIPPLQWPMECQIESARYLTNYPYSGPYPWLFPRSQRPQQPNPPKLQLPPAARPLEKLRVRCQPMPRSLAGQSPIR